MQATVCAPAATCLNSASLSGALSHHCLARYFRQFLRQQRFGGGTVREQRTVGVGEAPDKDFSARAKKAVIAFLTLYGTEKVHSELGGKVA